MNIAEQNPVITSYQLMKIVGGTDVQVAGDSIDVTLKMYILLSDSVLVNTIIYLGIT